MAKWDLSKLPEGRKPLPDEWFAERAQMQGRIKELEQKLAADIDQRQEQITTTVEGLTAVYMAGYMEGKQAAEAELAEYKHVASAIDTQWAESQDEIADLKAKQKKAAQYFSEIILHCANSGRGVPSIDERIIERCEDTAADAIEYLAGGGK